MNKRLMIVTILFLVISLLGCEKTVAVENEKEENLEGGDNMDYFELVSVEEFKEYYNITDDEITDEVIENYIFDYDATAEVIKKYNYYDGLKTIINSGRETTLGYNLRKISSPRNNASKPMDEFVYDARWIYILIYYPSHTEFVGPGENMVIDFKNKKIYSNSKEEDYRQADCSAELTDEAIEDIRREFPKCMSDENKGTTRCGYTYEVYIVDAKKNGIKYEKYDGENYNVSFDAYWKELYKESFKKKHVPNTEIR